MGIPVLIDAKVKADITALSERALKHVVPFDILLGFAHGRYDPAILPRLNQAATIKIPVYHRMFFTRDDIVGAQPIRGLYWEATFTLEEQKPGVPFRHLSVSCSRRDRIPNEHAMNLLMAEFGFARGLMECNAWDEKMVHGGSAINVIEPIDGDWNSLEPRTVEGLRYDPRIEALRRPTT